MEYKEELIGTWIALLNPEGLQVHPVAYGLALTSLPFSMTHAEDYFIGPDQADRYYRLMIEFEQMTLLKHIPKFDLSYRRMNKAERDLHKRIMEIAQKINLTALGARS